MGAMVDRYAVCPELGERTDTIFVLPDSRPMTVTDTDWPDHPIWYLYEGINLPKCTITPEESSANAEMLSAARYNIGY